LFSNLIDYIKYHHERYDGSGYPYGIKGDDIPIESQILAISDVFDAITTSRIYKARKNVTEALEEIKALSNTHFKSDLVDVAIKALEGTVIDTSITQQPLTNIEKERFSYFYKDQTTQVFNSNYLDLLLIKNNYSVEYKYITVISIHNLNSLNEKKGWESGNLYLKNVSNNLERIYQPLNVFRVFSDDFAILSDQKLNIDKDKLSQFICKEEISLEIERYDIEENKIYSFHDLEILRIGANYNGH